MGVLFSLWDTQQAAYVATHCCTHIQKVRLTNIKKSVLNWLVGSYCASFRLCLWACIDLPLPTAHAQFEVIAKVTIHIKKVTSYDMGFWPLQP